MLESYKAMAEFIADEFDMQYSHRTLPRWIAQGLPVKRARTGRVYVKADVLRTWFARTILA